MVAYKLVSRIEVDYLDKKNEERSLHKSKQRENRKEWTCFSM